MFRKDIQVAWDLLTILGDDWKKVYGLVLELNEKYQLDVTEPSLSKIISHLANHGIIETRKGCGVRRSTKKIIFMDEIFLVFGFNFPYSTRDPYGRVILRVKDMVRRTYFRNDRLLEDRKDI